MKQVTEKLMKWYEDNKRDLPWRKNKNPYYIWISEIMLQQTRVEAVKPYFYRFIEELPTIKSLANASDDQLHKLWQGLGYYNRVKNMKRCANICAIQYNGNLPSNYDELLTLPGIGPYTAGAIASIAFNQKVCAIDGNVLRVFARILCLDDDISKQSTKKKFDTLIQEYLPDEGCDIFNQAVMELGALICIPNGAPLCNICPIQTQCKAYQLGKQSQLPVKNNKVKQKIEKKTIIIITNQSQVVLHKRKEGLLEGMYEFTTVSKQVNRKELKDLISIDYNIKSIKKLPKAKHIFSHRIWDMDGYLVEVEKLRDDDIKATKEELDTIFAIPTAFKTYYDICNHYLNDFE